MEKKQINKIYKCLIHLINDRIDLENKDNTLDNYNFITDCQLLLSMALDIGFNDEDLSMIIKAVRDYINVINEYNQTKIVRKIKEDEEEKV